MAGRSRSVRGHSEAAKGVASRTEATVAWSIEAAPAVERAGLVTPNSPRRRLIFKALARTPSGLKALSGRKAGVFSRISWHWRDRTLLDRVLILVRPVG